MTRSCSCYIYAEPQRGSNENEMCSRVRACTGQDFTWRRSNAHMGAACCSALQQASGQRARWEPETTNQAGGARGGRSSAQLTGRFLLGIWWVLFLLGCFFSPGCFFWVLFLQGAFSGCFFLSGCLFWVLLNKAPVNGCFFGKSTHWVLYWVLFLGAFFLKGAL